jgi:hypothetical protein
MYFVPFRIPAYNQHFIKKYIYYFCISTALLWLLISFVTRKMLSDKYSEGILYLVLSISLYLYLIDRWTRSERKTEKSSFSFKKGLSLVL